VTVTNNLSNGNHFDGLHQNNLGDRTLVTLSGNQAFFNGELGIGGLVGVTDGGHNKASGNGTAVQCTNVVCS
jgi:hypothetical protein